jgi:hypothetical protein
MSKTVEVMLQGKEKEKGSEKKTTTINKSKIVMKYK